MIDEEKTRYIFNFFLINLRMQLINNYKWMTQMENKKKKIRGWLLNIHIYICCLEDAYRQNYDNNHLYN